MLEVLFLARSLSKRLILCIPVNGKTLSFVRFCLRKILYETINRFCSS